MPRASERGIAHLLILIILALGLAGGLYLVSNPQIFQPKASAPLPLGPEVSFALRADKNEYSINSSAIVTLYVRSDHDLANLFNAKINFNKDLLEVTEITPTGTFIGTANIIENTYDNNAGTISIVGTIPNPGGKTTTGESAATIGNIYFKIKSQPGTASITFDNSSQIISNSDNLNIIAQLHNGDHELNITINPAASSSPVSGENRVFVTSASYTGNLGGVSGADQKCQDSANSASLGGTWKAWVSNVSARFIHSNKRYKLLNGTTIANNWADLTDNDLISGISVNESGNTVGQVKVWTANSNAQDPGSFCNEANAEGQDWKNASASLTGHVGEAARSNFMWASIGGTQSIENCSNSYRLYCFEQTENTSAGSDTCTVDITVNSDTSVNADLLGSSSDSSLQLSLWAGDRLLQQGPIINSGSLGIHFNPQQYGTTLQCRVATDTVGGSYTDGFNQRGTIVYSRDYTFNLPSESPSPSPSPVASSAPGAVSGDGNNDGVVNLIDLSILLSNYNKTSGFPPGIDLNTDGIINLFDRGQMINILIQNGALKGN